MRKRRCPASTLYGQLLFAQHRDDVFTVDCLLSNSEGGPAEAVTFIVRFPVDTRSAARALELLGTWADEGTPVEVRVSDGRSGPHVEIATVDARVVLEPDDVAHADS